MKEFSDETYYKLYIWACCNEVPDWMPMPLQGYEYHNIEMVMYMKPKPKLRHILRYKFVPRWWSRLKAKRFIENTFKDIRKD